MKRSIALMAVPLLLLMLLSGCAGEVEQAGASPDVSMPADSATAPETTPREPVLDFSYDESACTPWQTAYLTLLRDIISRETPERIAEIEGSPEADYSMQLSYSYCLYDVDKDQIPEIFIQFGCYKADFQTEVYTFQSGSAVFVGDFYSGHSSLHTWPGENAVVCYRAHMSYCEMDKISVVDGSLMFEEIYADDINEVPVRDYTQPDEIVPDAVDLPAYWTILNHELTTPWMNCGNYYPLPSPDMFMPLTLPIYDYCPATSARNMAASGDTKKAVAELLEGKRELYGVSGDGFGGDTGWLSFHDYCQPGAVAVLTDYPMRIVKSGWVDFNGDGREECILYLEEGPQAKFPAEIYVVLSAQDGVVYAYSFNFMEDYDVFQDGVFYKEGYENGRGISFFKNQCYVDYKPHDIGTPAIVWTAYDG